MIGARGLWTNASPEVCSGGGKDPRSQRLWGLQHSQLQAEGNGTLAACTAPDSSALHTLYAKSGALALAWAGRSQHLHCPAQRYASPGQQPSQESPVQPRPGAGLPQTEVNRR